MKTIKMVKTCSYAALSLLGGKALYRRSPFLLKRRRLYALIMHLTWPRLFNILLCLLERRLRRARLSSRPHTAVIEPSNICNLNCPLCASANENAMSYDVPRGYLKAEFFSSMINCLLPYLCRIILYNWGEPLLNPELFNIISMASDKDIGVELSTNLVNFSPDMADKLIDSRLERIILSIDGASADTYNRYRRGGDFDRVIENVKTLVGRKKSRGALYPIVEWQFVPMSHNEHEVRKAEETSKELGADVFSVIPFDILSYSSDYEIPIERARPFFPREDRHRATITFDAEGRPKLKKTVNCEFLYGTTTINWDGSVFYCCPFSTKKSQFLGKMPETGYSGLWNSKNMVEARRVLKNRARNKAERTTGGNIPCHHCLSGDSTAMR